MNETVYLYMIYDVLIESQLLFMNDFCSMYFLQVLIHRVIIHSTLEKYIL